MGLRALFTTSPLLPKRISRITTLAHPPRLVLPTQGALGSLDRAELDRIVTALRRDGCYVFPHLLDHSLVAGLRSAASTLTRYASLPAGTEPVVYDPARVVSGRYLCKQEDLVDLPVVQQLMADPSILAVADTYLHCDAVQVDIGAWQSVVFGPDNRSESSQLFHSDRDHLQFLKFFVYLSDVNADSGPHVFVRGSHRARPEPLKRDIRFGDEEVLERFASHDVIEHLGPCGTILAVDTSGLHKGKPPESGERWIFELAYASSRFGPGGLPFDIRVVAPELEQQMRRRPWKYSRFRVVN